MQVLSCFTLFIFEFGKFRKDFGKFRKDFGKLWERIWKFLDFFGSSWKNSEMLGIGFWIDQRFEVLVDFFAD